MTAPFAIDLTMPLPVATDTTALLGGSNPAVS